MARLSREAGVDPGKGVAILNGSQEKLISLLRTMATTHRNDMEKLRTCLERGAHEEARGIVHTLRGVAAMLGAKVLLSALGAVDAKLRASPGIAAGDMVQLIAAANQELERLFWTIVGSADRLHSRKCRCRLVQSARARIAGFAAAAGAVIAGRCAASGGADTATCGIRSHCPRHGWSQGFGRTGVLVPSGRQAVRTQCLACDIAAVPA